MERPHQSMLRGVLSATFAAIAWGVQFPVAGTALRWIDPFMFTTLRYAAASVIFLLILRITEGKTAFRFEGKGKSLWFYGTMAFCAYNFLVFWGQRMAGKSGAVIASIMMSMMPVITMLLTWIIQHKAPSQLSAVCALTAFAGILTIVTKGNPGHLLALTDHSIAFLLILAGAVCWVIYTMGNQAFPDWSSLRYTTLSCLLGTVSSLAVTSLLILTGILRVPMVNTLQTIAPQMSYMIAVAGVAAVLAWNTGNRLLTPVIGVFFIHLVPVTSLLVNQFHHSGLLFGKPTRELERDSRTAG